MNINKNNILPVVAIAVAGIMIGAGAISILNPEFGLFGDISLQSTHSTSLQNNYISGDYAYKDDFNACPLFGTSVDGSNIPAGFDDNQYITSWWDKGHPEGELDSEKMIFRGAAKAYSYGWGFNIFDYKPTLLLGQQWWKITFEDAHTGNSVLIADKGYFNSNMAKLQDGTYHEHNIPNLDYPGTDFGSPSSEWWGAPSGATGGEGKLDIRNLDAGSIAIRLIGNKAGWLKAELYMEWAEIETWYSWGTWHHKYHYHNGDDAACVQTQYSKVVSGAGDIELTKTNKVTLSQGAYADGTNEYYTKYTYEEGTADSPTMVPLKIKTGGAGPTAGESGTDNMWRLSVINNNNGNTVLDKYYGDQKTIDVNIPIPEGTWEEGGTNTFSVKLLNGLDEIEQASIELFVIDSYEKAPSDARVTTNGETFNVGDTVEVQCKAYSNPKTEEPITHFRVFARKGSYTTGTYAYGPKTIIATNTGTQEYSSSFSFTPEYRAYYYIQAVPYDAAGRYGGEGRAQVTVTSAPTYTLTVRVQDSDGEPISGAEILIGNLFRKATFSSGEREFDIEGGSYTITVMHSSYNTSEETYFINTDKTITVTMLEPGEEGGGGTTPGEDDESSGQGTGDNSFSINVFADNYDTAVKGASVSLSIGYSGITDNNGLVTFKLLDTELVAMDATVEATGYETVTLSFSKEEVEAGYYSFNIDSAEGGGEKEESEYPVTIHVYEAGGTEVIEWASVSTSSGQATQTDESGIADLTFYSKSGSVTVTADGYNEKTKELSESDITGGYIEIGLTPISQEDDDGDKDTFTIYVQVGDSETNYALDGAMVTFDGITKSADGGTAIFSDVTEGYYAIRADMKGYETKEKSIAPDLSNTDFTILLKPSTNPEDSDNEAEEQTPKTKYDFSVVVTNGGSNTYVQLGDLDATYGQQCYFKISEGTYKLTVGMGGYETWNGEVTIPDETSKEVTLTEIVEEDKKSPIDIDGDGIRNSEDDDMDGDGIPNDEDADDDGDGIPDINDDRPYVQDIQEVDLLSIFTDNLMYIVIGIVIIIFAIVGIAIYRRRTG